MNELQELHLNCPYCAEGNTFLLDTCAGEQEYYEDCQVCCRPILISFDVDSEGSATDLRIRREDDAY